MNPKYQRANPSAKYSDAAATRILLLEDNLGDVALVRALLDAEGLCYELRHVTTGEEFTAALKGERLDVVISDFSLPSYDGLTALALRQEVAPGVPFVLFSGSLGEDHAVDSLKKNATDYVVKQRPDRLAPAVRRALEEARERIERQRTEAALAEKDGWLCESDTQQCPQVAWHHRRRAPPTMKKRFLTESRPDRRAPA